MEDVERRAELCERIDEVIGPHKYWGLVSTFYLLRIAESLNIYIGDLIE